MEESKICVVCNTSKTPLWRTGPAGPKSLCNAYGIRFRKKRSIVKSDKKKPTQTPTPAPAPSATTASVVPKLKMKVVRHRKEAVLLKRQRSSNRRFGEVEQAACLLMSLSYYAPVSC